MEKMVKKWLKSGVWAFTRSKLSDKIKHRGKKFRVADFIR